VAADSSPPNVSLPLGHHALIGTQKPSSDSTERGGPSFLAVTIRLWGSTRSLVVLFEGRRPAQRMPATMRRLEETEASAQSDVRSVPVVGETPQTVRSQLTRPSGQDCTNRGAANGYYVPPGFCPRENFSTVQTGRNCPKIAWTSTATSRIGRFNLASLLADAFREGKAGQRLT
jgi:hypothetical protein